MTARAFRFARLPRGLRPLVTEAISLAHEPGRILRRRFRQGVQVTAKDPAEIVTATARPCGRRHRRVVPSGIIRSARMFAFLQRRQRIWL